MTNAPWMAAYWFGSWRNKTVTGAPAAANDGAAAKVADAAARSTPAFSVTLTPLPGVPGKSETSFVVSVTANPGAKPADAAADATRTRPPGPLALASPPGGVAVQVPAAGVTARIHEFRPLRAMP